MSLLITLDDLELTSSGQCIFKEGASRALGCPLCRQSVCGHTAEEMRLFLLGQAHPVDTAPGINPKDLIGSSKAGTFAVSRRVYMLLGLSMGEGGTKYGRFNYRVAPVRASVYCDALDRHMAAWIEGQDIDPDSGLPHLVKAMATLAVLLDAQLQGTWEDDRPPGNGADGKWLEELNASRKAFLTNYKGEHVAPFTRKSLVQGIDISGYGDR